MNITLATRWIIDSINHLGYHNVIICITVAQRDGSYLCAPSAGWRGRRKVSWLSLLLMSPSSLDFTAMHQATSSITISGQCETIDRTCILETYCQQIIQTCSNAAFTSTSYYDATSICQGDVYNGKP